MDPEEIIPGSSYGCYFTVYTFVNSQGEVVDTKRLQPGQAVRDGKPGNYQGFGIIQKRDQAKRLFEIWDQHNQRTWVVDWNNCRDIDSVEWLEPSTPQSESNSES